MLNEKMLTFLLSHPSAFLENLVSYFFKEHWPYVLVRVGLESFNPSSHCNYFISILSFSEWLGLEKRLYGNNTLSYLLLSL